jgi:hypothetical protein
MWVSDAWMKMKSGDSGIGARAKRSGPALAESTARQNLPTARYPLGTLTYTIPRPPGRSSRKVPSTPVVTTPL